MGPSGGGSQFAPHVQTAPTPPNPPPRPPRPPHTPAPAARRRELMDQLSALSGLRGLRVLRLELELTYDGHNASPADALATLARSHPALEEVRLPPALRGAEGVPP
jgi:hypothetical protein